MEIKRDDFYTLILGLLQAFIFSLHVKLAQTYIPIWFKYLSEGNIRFLSILFFISTVFMIGNMANLAAQFKAPKNDTYYNVSMVSVIVFILILANFTFTAFLLKGKI